MSVTFKVNPREDVAQYESVKNRLIEYVTEYKIKSIDGKKYVGWYGTTETEFFSIVFVGGVVSVSLAERQMQIGESYCLPLIVSKLEKAALIDDQMEKIRILSKYNLNYANRDLEKATFKDIMKPLGWKFASKKVKVQYDLVESGFYDTNVEEPTPINITL